VHHAGRSVFSALGSRSDRLPAPARAAISLERRGDGGDVAPPATPPDGAHTARFGGWLKEPREGPHEYEAIRRFYTEGPAPLLDPVPGMADRERLHIAVVIPPFQRGSGGHGTIFNVVSRLERMGHTCSVWLHDQFGDHRSEAPAVVRRNINDWFSPVRAPVFKGFDDWYGADVVMATGWQTVFPALGLDGCRARAYFVNDHEPEFSPTSIDAWWAADTYRQGLHCIAASPWLRDLLHDRYGASATDFVLGVDFDVYRPAPVERHRDTVVFYARMVTPRRGVPLGIFALEELHRRRPGLRVVMFGDKTTWPALTFPYEHLSVAIPAKLAEVYSASTVGLCLSMTNFSLIPKEMMACGMPCVELAGVSAESIFGADGPIELAEFDPVAVADHLERLLDDEQLWERRSRDGREFVASHTWELGAQQTEAGLREALRERERELAAT